MWKWEAKLMGAKGREEEGEWMNEAQKSSQKEEI